MGDSFAYYRLPLSISKDASPSTATFEIGGWLAPYSRRIIVEAPQLLPNLPIHSQFNRDPQGLIKEELQHNQPYANENQPVDADLHQYLTSAEAIIRSCQQRGGKSVFSRMIKGYNSSLSPINVAAQLEAIFPNAFVFLFSTPETGCWIGATPETLLNFDYRTRRIETMAYAGTRPYAGDQPWDEKNLRENKFVADHIIEKFRQLGIEPTISEPYSSPYGAIQHLRRDISATLPDDLEFWQILDAINPTPALCGTPTDAAIADINRYESAPRGCYGGFVAVHHPGEYFRSFVCLRCAQLYPDGKFEIHTGGGLTPDSNPLSEYRETEAKASLLLRALSTN